MPRPTWIKEYTNYEYREYDNLSQSVKNELKAKFSKYKQRASSSRRCPVVKRKAQTRAKVASKPKSTRTPLKLKPTRKHNCKRRLTKLQQRKQSKRKRSPKRKRSTPKRRKSVVRKHPVIKPLKLISAYAGNSQSRKKQRTVKTEQPLRNARGPDIIAPPQGWVGSLASWLTVDRRRRLEIRRKFESRVYTTQTTTCPINRAMMREYIALELDQDPSSRSVF